MFIDTLFKVMPDFFGDTTHTVPWTVPFSTRPFHPISFHRCAHFENPTCSMANASDIVHVHIYIYTYIYMYLYNLIYVYFLLDNVCKVCIFIFLICSRANYHHPHFMTNFTFLGIPGVCWCSSCLHQSHHSVQSHMVKLPWGR